MATKITRSPRAPSLDLEESLRRALKLLEKEGKHAVPAELAVKHMGYSGINNGAAARALASLKAFGLVEVNSKGDVAAAKSVEDYAYAPEDAMKRQLVVRWVRSPKVYSDLLDEYSDRLPSDQAIRYRLINMGFTPTAAEECCKSFKASVAFSRYYDKSAPAASIPATEHVDDAEVLGGRETASNTQAGTTTPATSVSSAIDRIPIRLSGGRRAHLEVPTPLYKADKELIRKHLDLLLTDDDE